MKLWYYIMKRNKKGWILLKHWNKCMTIILVICIIGVGTNLVNIIMLDILK